MPICNTSSNNNHHLVTLPNPWTDPNTFGQRLKQWALENNTSNDHHSPEGRSSSRRLSGAGCDYHDDIGTISAGAKDDLWLGGNKLLQVSLGYYWNSRAQRGASCQHMGMVLEVTNIDDGDGSVAANNNDGEERIVVDDEDWGSDDNKKKMKQTARSGSRTQQRKPMWTMNCYLGGGNDDDNNDGSAPLVLSHDNYSQQPEGRPWASTTSNSPKYEWLEVYHMKALTFDRLLRRFIRWGYAVGSLSMTTASTNSRHRQRTSVAILTTWWMQEAGHHLMGGGRYGIPSSHQTATRLAAIREPAFQEVVAPRIAHTIHNQKPYYYIKLFGCFVSGKKKNPTRAEENTKYQLIGFLSSAGIADIMELNDDKVNQILEEYELKRKSSCHSSDSKFCFLGDIGDHTCDTNACSGTFYSGAMIEDEECPPTPANDYNIGASRKSKTKKKDLISKTMARLSGRGVPSVLTNSQTQRWLRDGPTPDYDRLPSFLLKMSKQANEDLFQGQ